jgi:hypothetical protein
MQKNTSALEDLVCLPFVNGLPNPKQSKPLYLNAHYLTLRRICHNRCVICGGSDWLLFERIDSVPTSLVDPEHLFSFWFGGLSAKRTAAVCMDCQIQARLPFWDRRITARQFDPFVNTSVSDIKEHYYYGWGKSPITHSKPCISTINRTSAEYKKLWISHRKGEMTRLLGGKCTRCPQVIDLDFHTRVRQFINHTADQTNLKWIYYDLQMAAGNLLLLCKEHHAARSSHEKRITGQLHRIFQGIDIVAWLGTNRTAEKALADRLAKRPASDVVVKPHYEIISTSVESCGHRFQFTWLLADERRKWLVFCCEACLKRFPSAKKVGLVLSRDRKLKEAQRDYRGGASVLDCGDFLPPIPYPEMKQAGRGSGFRRGLIHI